MKYVRNLEHKKKYKTLDAWRIHKYLKKDKCKPHWYTGGSTKKFYTTKGHKSHRRWCRIQLNLDNYLVLHRKDIMSFCNPWDWS